MSMEIRKKRMPPATKKEPGEIPKKERINLPTKIKTLYTTKATVMAFHIVRRFSRSDILPVVEIKSGTIPMGSMTMKIVRNIWKKVLSITEEYTLRTRSARLLRV